MEVLVMYMLLVFVKQSKLIRYCVVAIGEGF